MKTIRYGDPSKLPQKHEFVTGVFMRPSTPEELFERHGIDQDLPVSADLLFFQTGDPGFLCHSHPDVPLSNVYNGSTPADCIMFYWNMMQLMKLSGITLDLATRTFSNLNNKSAYTRFLQGKGYAFLNIRLAAEFSAAMSLTKEEISMMFTGPITTTEKPYVEKINKNRVGTKNRIAEELSKLVEQVEVNPLEDATLDQPVIAGIRAGISGRSYMHLETFVPLMRYCGVDPASAIYACQHLNVSVPNDDREGESVFYSMQSAMGQNLDAYQHTVVLDRTDDYVIMGLIAQNFMKSPDRSPENLMRFMHNMEYIKNTYPEAFETMKSMLIEKPLSLESVVEFLSKATGLEESEILTGVLMVPDSPQEEASDTGAAQEEVLHVRNPEPEAEEQPAALVAPNEDNEEKPAVEMKIETMLRVKHPCSNYSWRNENPNKEEDGYYWADLSEEEKEAICDQIREIPTQDLSIRKIRAIIEDAYPGSVKAYISIQQISAELAFGFSVD